MRKTSPQQQPRLRRYRMRARAEAATATRERILAAAWQQFSTDPYEQVHLGEIAAQSGVSVQTLHNCFGGKEGLFGASYRWWGAKALAGREAAGAGSMRAAVRALFDHYEQHGAAVLRMLAQEERIPAVRELTDAGRAYHRAWSERLFASQLRGVGREKYERRIAGIVVAGDLLTWKQLRQTWAGSAKRQNT